ncbi:MAG: vitamin K epoxide reductase family protein [Chthoniobacterales bacterium]
MNEAGSSAFETPRPKFRKRLYAVAAIVALLGLADGIYLTVEHVTGRTAQCIASSGCQEVLSSQYAAIGPIPLASLGALAYFTAFSTALLAAFGYPKCRLLFGLLVAIMFAVTLWLFYLQAFVLHAFCDYCLFSAGVTTVLTLIAITNAVLRDQR